MFKVIDRLAWHLTVRPRHCPSTTASLLERRTACSITLPSKLDNDALSVLTHLGLCVSHDRDEPLLHLLAAAPRLTSLDLDCYRYSGVEKIALNASLASKITALSLYSEDLHLRHPLTRLTSLRISSFRSVATPPCLPLLASLEVTRPVEPAEFAMILRDFPHIRTLDVSVHVRGPIRESLSALVGAHPSLEACRVLREHWVCIRKCADPAFCKTRRLVSKGQPAQTA